MILRDGQTPFGRNVGPSYARSQNRRGAAIPAVRPSDGVRPNVQGATQQRRSDRPSPWRATASIEAMG